MTLAKGTLSFLFQPFVETTEVVEVHALDLSNLLALLYLVQTNCAVLVRYCGRQKPTYSDFIGFFVLLVEKILISQP